MYFCIFIIFPIFRYSSNTNINTNNNYTSKKNLLSEGFSPKLAQLRSLRWCWWRVIDTHLLEEVEEAFICLCPLFTHLPKRVARALLHCFC
jgi:hypothetical protein